MNHEQVERGQELWLPDEKDLWCKVKILDIDQTDPHLLTVVKINSATANTGKQSSPPSTMQVNIDSIYAEHGYKEIGQKVLRANAKPVADMTQLQHIHEPAILHNLVHRMAKEKQPYTLMANVLVAVNPLQRLPQPKIKDYSGGNKNKNAPPPHPYAVAEFAYQQLFLLGKKSQSIVISGESGAGKTETSKIILKYLSSRDQIVAKQLENDTITADDSLIGKRRRSSQVIVDDIDRRLVETNPILEAFGNAKTLRNHNSSRFGKFMKLQYASTNKSSCQQITSGSMETYLLEKFRVITQLPGERNFHIFYFLLAGASEELKKKLLLVDSKNIRKRCQDFKYLFQGKCTKDKRLNDSTSFQEVVNALRCIGLDHLEQESIFQILSGILHLGNVELVEHETDEGDVGVVSSETSIYLKLASELFGLDPVILEQIITQRQIVTPGESFVIKRSVQESTFIRDSISKFLYQHVFHWLIKQINVSLNYSTTATPDSSAPPLSTSNVELPFIGILDIFGFESFKQNELEQLLINYANESLQATFNEHVFKAEQELFLSEGIDFDSSSIIFPENKDCIKLLADKPHGILTLLNQEAETTRPSDSKWNSNLYKKHSSNPYFLKPHSKDRNHTFIVKHFAMSVTYTIGTFLSKNEDTIPEDLQRALLSSHVPLMQQILPGSLVSPPPSSRNRRKRFRLSKKSVSWKFISQMDQLGCMLNATRCHFIRCLKPNFEMKPHHYDPIYLIHQLRATGMLATCELLQVGLPTRVSYYDIFAMYQPMLPEHIFTLFDKYIYFMNPSTFTKVLFWVFQIDTESYFFGKTKVFFKTGKMHLLEQILKVDLSDRETQIWIVKRLEKWAIHRKWRFALVKVNTRLCFVKMLADIRQKNYSALHIQSIARMYIQRTKYIFQRDYNREMIRKKIMARKGWKVLFRVVSAQLVFQNMYDTSRDKLHKESQSKNRAANVIQNFFRFSRAKRLEILENKHTMKKLELSCRKLEQSVRSLAEESIKLEAESHEDPIRCDSGGNKNATASCAFHSNFDDFVCESSSVSTFEEEEFFEPRIDITAGIYDSSINSNRSTHTKSLRNRKGPTILQSTPALDYRKVQNIDIGENKNMEILHQLEQNEMFNWAKWASHIVTGINSSDPNLKHIKECWFFFFMALFLICIFTRTVVEIFFPLAMLAIFMVAINIILVQIEILRVLTSLKVDNNTMKYKHATTTA